MELLIALYATPLGFHPELIGWWGLWDLRVSLVAMPLLCLAAHINTRRSIRSIRSR